MADPQTQTPRDSEQLIAWVREAACELEKAHALLDRLVVPRNVLAGAPTECSLAARIMLLAARGSDA